MQVPMFGWIARDNHGTMWRDWDFPQHEGSPTSWSQFVDWLDEDGRWLVYFALRYGKEYYALPDNADTYALHYRLEVSLGSKNEGEETLIGTAVSGDLATIRTIDKDGHSTSKPTYTKYCTLMKPSPLAKL